MSQTRRYRLLCPIARALDRIGDRWTLLILRDLHAGPARFSELQTLPGLASNLLTTRLRQLEEDGLIRRRSAEYGASVYELTELGRHTGDVLFELAAFGSRFPPDASIEKPGNLRTIAVTLQVACQRVVDPSIDLRSELVVDGEAFELTVLDGAVAVRAGAAETPEVVFTTSYEPMVAVADGRMTMDDFTKKHVQLAGDDAKVQALVALLANAIAVIRGD